MAVAAWVQVTNPEEGSAGRIYKTTLNANDCSTALAVVPWADCTVQLIGTGPVTLRGSLKKAGRVGDADVANPASAGDWFNLSDYDSTAATLTTSGTGMSLKQNVVSISALAGGGVSGADIYIFLGSSR